MTIVVRRIDQDEWERFKEVRLRALADAPFAFSSKVQDERTRPDAYWRTRLERSDGASFAALDEQAWLGIVGVFPSDDDTATAHLVSMWVDPAVRGRGVGTLLVDAAIRWAQTHAFDRIDLWVTETNAPAIHLYESRGFRPGTDRQPLDSNPSLAEFIMHRDLP